MVGCLVGIHGALSSWFRWLFPGVVEAFSRGSGVLWKTKWCDQILHRGIQGCKSSVHGGTGWWRLMTSLFRCGRIGSEGNRLCTWICDRPWTWDHGLHCVRSGRQGRVSGLHALPQMWAVCVDVQRLTSLRASVMTSRHRRSKSGVVISLFLSALKICCPEYLNEEFNRIIRAFTRLHFPEGILLRLQRTAIGITERGPRECQ